MYRIELAPGEEAALRNVDELAAGIRTGVITPRARIWHNAGQKWLPIELHPHYQAALKQIEAEPPAETDVTIAEAVIEVQAASAAGVERRSFRRPIVLAVAGAALVASAHVVASATSADEAPSGIMRMAVFARPAPTLAARPATDAISPSSTSTASLPSSTATPEPGAAGNGAPVAHAIVGGLVRGPDPFAVAPAPRPTPKPAPKPSASEDTSEIAPAPVVTELPMPPLPADSAN